MHGSSYRGGARQEPPTSRSKPRGFLPWRRELRPDRPGPSLRRHLVREPCSPAPTSVSQCDGGDTIVVLTLPHLQSTCDPRFPLPRRYPVRPVESFDTFGKVAAGPSG